MPGMLVVMALIGCSGAQSRELVAPKTPIRPLLLWRVSGQGVAPSYLFGTCHLGVTLDRALPADQRSALDTARVVALEIDLSTPIDPLRVISRLMLPDSQSLRLLVGEETWNVLVHREPLARLPWMVIDRMHPFVVLEMLSVADSHAPHTQNASEGMDSAIGRAAVAHGARMVGLETVDEQTAMIRGLSPAAYVPEIRSALTHATAIGTSMRSLFYACAWGDDATLARLTSRMPDALLTVRNAAWLPRVEGLVRDGGAFVAVGAGHLVGPSGLVASLTAHGFRVERLSSTAEDEPGFEMHINPPVAESTPSAAPSEAPRLASGSPVASSPPPSDLPARGFPEWAKRFGPAFAARMCTIPVTRVCVAAESAACVSRYEDAARWCLEESAAAVVAAHDVNERRAVGGTLGLCTQRSIETLARFRQAWESLPQCNDPASWRFPDASPAPSAASPSPPPPPAGPHSQHP